MLLSYSVSYTSWIPCELSAWENSPLRFCCLYSITYTVALYVFILLVICVQAGIVKMWFCSCFPREFSWGEKQCACFSSYLTKPKTIPDLDTYKEICSTQSKSKGLLFLFQLWKLTHFYYEKSLGSIALTLNARGLFCSITTQKGQEFAK